MAAPQQIILHPALDAVAAVTASLWDVETWKEVGGPYPGILGVRVTPNADGSCTLEGTDGQVAVSFTLDASPVADAAPELRLPDIRGMVPPADNLFRRIPIDVRRLRALAYAAEALCGGKVLHTVDLEVYATAGSPIVLRGRPIWNDDRQGEFLGILHPVPDKSTAAEAHS